MYGNQKSFTSLAFEIPSVVTLDVIHIQNNSAVGVARVTDQGNDPNIERGVCWSRRYPDSTTDLTIDNADGSAINGMGEGNYSVEMTGLTPNARQWFMAMCCPSIPTFTCRTEPLW